MFQQFRKLQAFERQHLPYLKNPTENVLIVEIGYHQEQGQLLTVKGLLLLNLGAPATVRRQLQKLVRLGVVHKQRVLHDARVYQLAIDPAVRETYAKYLKLLSRL